MEGSRNWQLSFFAATAVALFFAALWVFPTLGRDVRHVLGLDSCAETDKNIPTPIVRPNTTLPCPNIYYFDLATDLPEGQKGAPAKWSFPDGWPGGQTINFTVYKFNAAQDTITPTVPPVPVPAVATGAYISAPIYRNPVSSSSGNVYLLVATFGAGPDQHTGLYILQVH
jgi:hypothetical protein